MEIEIKESIPLLDGDGHIRKEGWARYPYWQYRREEIRHGSLKRKEWDYYQIINQKDEYAVNLTFSDLGLFSLISISYVDYRLKKTASESALKFLTRNRSGLAESPCDDYAVTYADKKITLSIIKKGEKRQIIANAPEMVLPDGRKGLMLDVLIIDDQKESLNIATSWKEDRTRFYYNEKRGGMRASGKIMRDMQLEDFSALALLDWGRGVWLRSSTWYWSALMGEDGNARYMVNIGCGFTDRSPAGENCIIYDGEVFKIGNVDITVPESIDKGKWIFKDSEGKLFLEMTPAVNRKDYNDYKIIVSNQDQVFGLFNGFITIGEKKLEITGGLGFAERVYNKW